MLWNTWSLCYNEIHPPYSISMHLMFWTFVIFYIWINESKKNEWGKIDGNWQASYISWFVNIAEVNEKKIILSIKNRNKIENVLFHSCWNALLGWFFNRLQYRWGFCIWPAKIVYFYEWPIYQLDYMWTDSNAWLLLFFFCICQIEVDIIVN